jgi:Cof subfamily protein (haloacid dehalogenase superfamily)
VIGLILIDLDGTLVQAGNRVAPSSWEAIDKARCAGRRVAVCTGRPCSGYARFYADAIDTDAPHIFDSGAVLCRPSGELVHVEAVQRASFERLVGIARDHNVPMEVYTADQAYVERPDRYTLAHAEILNVHVEERDVLTIAEPIVRVQWILPWATWPRFEALTAMDPLLGISVATQPDIVETCFSSITARGVSKASAAKRLAEWYGLGLHEVAMVGDGDNDLDAIEAVGLGIAMGNANETVRLAADAVVAHIEQDGLAEAIDLALTG